MSCHQYLVLIVLDMEACEVQIEGEMPTVIRMIMSIQRDFVTTAPDLPSKHIEIVKILNILIVLI